MELRSRERVTALANISPAGRNDGSDLRRSPRRRGRGSFVEIRDQMLYHQPYWPPEASLVFGRRRPFDAP